MFTDLSNDRQLNITLSGISRDHSRCWLLGNGYYCVHGFLALRVFNAIKPLLYFVSSKPLFNKRSPLISKFIYNAIMSRKLIIINGNHIRYD